MEGSVNGLGATAGTPWTTVLAAISAEDAQFNQLHLDQDVRISGLAFRTNRIRTFAELGINQLSDRCSTAFNLVQTETNRLATETNRIDGLIKGEATVQSSY